jgi:hypothetical protein
VSCSIRDRVETFSKQRRGDAETPKEVIEILRDAATAIIIP